MLEKQVYFKEQSSFLELPADFENDSRPWQRRLIRGCRNEWSVSQQLLSEATMKLNFAAKILLSDDVYSRNVDTVDINDLKITKALSAIVDTLQYNGSLLCLRYFISEKMSEKLEPFLFNLCLKICNTQNYTLYSAGRASPPPPVLVLYWCAASILWGFGAGWTLESRTPDKLSENLSKLTFGQVHNFMPEAIGRETIVACDKFLMEDVFTDGISCVTPLLLGAINTNKVSLRCALCLDDCPGSVNAFSDILRMLSKRVDFKLSAVNDASQRSGFASLGGIAQLDQQFKYTQKSYMNLLDTNLISKTHPVNAAWHELTARYKKLLKSVLKLPKQQTHVDNYYIATVDRCLLTAMMAGVFKTVTAKEIEALVKEMKSAVAAITAWAPPVWKMEIQHDLYVAEENVLNFLRSLNPDSTASIDVLTPGFLEIYDAEEPPSGNTTKFCAACGRSPVDLQKCSACNSVWYCDSDCQKQDWKAHKNECKELQKCSQKGK